MARLLSANNWDDSGLLLAVDTKLRNVTSSLSRKRWGEVSMQEMGLTFAFAFLKAKTTIFQGGV